MKEEYNMKISVTDRMGRTLEELEGSHDLEMILERPYGFEDAVIIECEKNSFLEISLDLQVKTSIVYVSTGKFEYTIPVGFKTKAYHPDAFQGNHHRIMVKDVSDLLAGKRRNLALNGYDLRWPTGYYPHAEANFVTRDEPWFEGKNAIDGHLERDGHGAWPYQSWGGGLRDDLEFTLDFGREVLVDEIILYLRADYVDDHDVNWESGVLQFSDGENMPITMTKTKQGQSFKFPQKKITWLKLNQLKREVSEAFSALTQIEVYGFEI